MPQKLNVANLRLKSSVFEGHKPIPARHTGDGEDVSPALEWSGVPDGTAAFAVVMHDPDAPLLDGFTHWVTYGIPADATGLDEGQNGSVTGINSFGNSGYNGPAPPRGHGVHHYYFWVYALDDDLHSAQPRPAGPLRADRGPRHRAGTLDRHVRERAVSRGSAPAELLSGRGDEGSVGCA
jgi:Raf kinase inhibitor-like YbhB/YbcL family protein